MKYIDMMYLAAVGTLCTISGAIIYAVVRISLATNGTMD